MGTNGGTTGGPGFGSSTGNRRTFDPRIGPLCGNRVLNQEDGEECDDGNNRDFDGCSQDCLLERGTCGDGLVQTLLDEQCEPQVVTESLPYICDGHCRFHSLFCGNGQLDAGEECDEGAQNSNEPGDHCRSDCSKSRCGDGITDTPFESCDDGNRVGNDGCSRECRQERGAGSDTIGQVFDLGDGGDNGTSVNAGQIVTVVPHAPVGSTGPASIAIMAAGAAAGIGWVRRNKKRS